MWYLGQNTPKFGGAINVQSLISQHEFMYAIYETNKSSLMLLNNAANVIQPYFCSFQFWVVILV